MKATIDGREYDPAQAKHQATFLTYNDTEYVLYQTSDGDFFLLLDCYSLDGRELGPMEVLEDLAPEFKDVTPWGSRRPKSKTALRRLEQEWQRRVKHYERLVPLTNKEALAWCIKTQIPASLRGYLLDCL